MVLFTKAAFCLSIFAHRAMLIRRVKGHALVRFVVVGEREGRIDKYFGTLTALLSDSKAIVNTIWTMLAEVLAIVFAVMFFVVAFFVGCEFVAAQQFASRKAFRRRLLALKHHDAADDLIRCETGSHLGKV